MSEKKKYRINELLEGLSLKDNRKALRILPGVIGISPATLNNYRAIGLDDPQDIPHAIVVKLEQFFSLKPGQLQNFTCDVKPISAQPDNLTNKFQLT